MTEPKHNPQELLERIHLMMNYDLSMTYSENATIVSEQISPATRGSGYRMQLQSMPSDYLGSGGAFERNMYGNISKEKYAENLGKLPRVEGTSVSDLLIKTRAFFFSTPGLVGQVVLSILGSEIGLPIVFGALDIAILLNDLVYMSKEWRQSNLKPWSEAWFNFHLQDGPGMGGEYGNGFLRVLEDMILIITGGVFKLLGMGAKGIYKIVMEKLGKNVGGNIEKVSSFIISKKGYLNKLPKKISDWGENKMGTAQRALDLLKTPTVAVQTVKKNIPKAVAGGVLAYGFSVFFEKVLLPKIKDDTDGGVLDLTQDVPPDILQDLANTFQSKNPTLFPKKINKIQMVYNSKKQFVKFIIDGSSYGVIDEKNYLLKKL
jgi:hypothetical protein